MAGRCVAAAWPPPGLGAALELEPPRTPRLIRCKYKNDVTAGLGAAMVEGLQMGLVRSTEVRPKALQHLRLCQPPAAASLLQLAAPATIAAQCPLTAPSAAPCCCSSSSSSSSSYRASACRGAGHPISRCSPSAACLHRKQAVRERTHANGCCPAHKATMTCVCKLPTGAGHSPAGCQHPLSPQPPSPSPFPPPPSCRPPRPG